MAEGILTPEELAELRKISTPTISNAIETFGIRPRNTGFMSAEIKCLFPEMGVMVGYAATGTIMTEQPAVPGHGLSYADYWDHIVSIPAPRVCVLEDLDQPPGVGSKWGEVSANRKKALGCVGVVTNGAVRDLDEARALSFHFFAGVVSVSHAYVHYLDVGIPVKVGGIWVKPGDLIHADKHGVITIPQEIAKEVARVAREVEARERQTIVYCQSKDFTLEGLKERSRRR